MQLFFESTNHEWYNSFISISYLTCNKIFPVLDIGWFSVGTSHQLLTLNHAISYLSHAASAQHVQVF